MKWPFKDPPNVAVFTSKKIVQKIDWIQYVSHDEDDGAWQFHSTAGTNEEDASIVSLKAITEIDPSVISLSSLPLGWCASRSAKEAEWKTGKKP